MTSLNTVSTSFGGTAPHSLTELYGVDFDGGGAAPASGNPINLLAFTGKSPAPLEPLSATIGTSYTDADLVPPIMTSTSQSGYTVSGHAGNTDLLKAFNRSKSSNYPGTHALRFEYNTYQGSATNWTGVGSLDGAWVRIDLSSATKLRGFVIRSEATTNIPRDVRLLGWDGSSWNVVFTRSSAFTNPGVGRNNMNPIVITFDNLSASYSKYAFVWMRVSANNGLYLPRLAQFNLIPE